jgi:hypothetical protein
MGTKASTSLEQPFISEKWWLPPIYTCSAAFVLDGTKLSAEKIVQDLQPLRDEARMRCKRRWPIFLTQCFLVPVYCATSFSSEIVNWLMTRRVGLGRLGARLNPVLYNSEANLVEFKEALQNHNLNYYSFLKPLYGEGIARAARYFGNEPRLTEDKYDQLAAKLLKSKGT